MEISERRPILNPKHPGVEKGPRRDASHIATRRRDERRDATTRDARDASAHAVRRRRRRTRTMLASATNERINERTNERTNE
jgi:hypothetical protein